MDWSTGNMETAGGASVRLPGESADASMGGAPTLRGGAPGRRFRAGEVILGRYRVTGELGQGGMGVVYRCFDETAGIEVALKALPPEVGHNSGEMDEVRENFRLVERLHHPNIAGLKTLEKDPATGDYFLIMECVDGLDLRQWARKRRSEGRPLTLDEIVIVAHRIAAALDYAHEQRVIHRDIKPANVRVDFEGDVKVLDFGLAAQLHTSLSRVSQAYRGTSGTGPYMAPEQWRGQRQDARADQYALAATVYELFAGVPPFESHDIGVLRSAVLSEPPPLLENAPPHVNTALLRGLAKEPGERFASCGNFVKALGGVGSAKVLKSGSSKVEGGKPRIARMALMVAAAVAVVAVSVLSIQSYSARQEAVREDNRRVAETQRLEAEKAKEEASRAEAAKDAEGLFGDAGRAASRAAELFEKGAFADAAKAWQEASASYASAETRALAAQAYAKAKSDFESELGGSAAPRAVLLEKHGDAKWAEVKRLQKLGEASANDPAAGEKTYREALAALPGAVTEAERNGTPTLTVECDVAGARVSEGGTAYYAPHTFELKAGAGYTFVVSAGDGARHSALDTRYKPETFTFTADWHGPKTRRVVLEEVKGPLEGQPWASPASGMEFVWVPALKMWVGKYEVTNGEYRRKDPGHDSKHFKGHTLNGDRQPVVYVNFDDAKAYAEWMTERDKDKLDGLRYRVIAEDEWQTCAQCGDGRDFPWGNVMPPKYGNYSDSASPYSNKIDGYTDGFAVTCPGDRSGANEWGIYGLGGNVWECCAADVSGGSFGAWHGAAWDYNSPGALSVAYRGAFGGWPRGGDLGFRLALSR